MTNFNDVINLIGSARRLDPAKTETCVDLMKEFLRREALSPALRLTERNPVRDFSIPMSSVRHGTQYLDTIHSFSYSLAESRCLYAMINWYGCKETCPPAHGVPDCPIRIYHCCTFSDMGERFRESTGCL